MALAENEAITVGVLGIFGVDTHLSEEQVVISSVADREPPGWPLPALAVMLMMSRRTCLQMQESSAVFMGNLHLIIFLLAYSIWTVKSMNLREKSGGSLVYLALGLHP